MTFQFHPLFLEENRPFLLWSDVEKKLQVHSFTLCVGVFRAATLLLLQHRLINSATGDTTSRIKTAVTNLLTAASLGLMVSQQFLSFRVFSWHVLAAQSSFTHLSAALDGVPFSLHPKFEMQANVTVRPARADGSVPVPFPHLHHAVSLSGSEFSVKRHSHKVCPRH